MNIFQAVLCGIIYYLGNTCILGPGLYYTAYRPLVAGFLTGLVLGDPKTGTMVGANINLMYLGFISAGGSLPSDPGLAGVLGVAIAITNHLDTPTALAIAVPVGLLGTLLYFARLTANVYFCRLVDAEIEKGRVDRLWVYNLLLPQLLLAVICVVPCALACYFGSAYITPILNALGGTFMKALRIVGSMMPALGIAITMKFIFKGETRIFLFLGFLCAVYFGFSLIQSGLFAAVIAIIYAQVTKEQKGAQ